VLASLLLLGFLPFLSEIEGTPATAVVVGLSVAAGVPAFAGVSAVTDISVFCWRPLTSMLLLVSLRLLESLFFVGVPGIQAADVVPDVAGIPAVTGIPVFCWRPLASLLLLACKRTHLFRSEYVRVFSKGFHSRKIKGTGSRDPQE
jgi:hypothetical protein